MNFLNHLQALSALCGIAIIAFSWLRLKHYLKHSFCCL